VNPKFSRRLLFSVMGILIGSLAWVASSPAQAQTPEAESPHVLSLTVGKSAVVNTQQKIERIAVGFGDVAEAMAAGTNEVLVSGKAPGSTSLIVWQQGGGKTFFDVNVYPNRFLANSQLDSIRAEIAKELPGQDITASFENGAVFLRGRVKDLTSAGRAAAIASTLGRVVNLLYVDVPEAEQQILLKVRFASLDRSRSDELALNLFSTGATNTVGSTSTGQFAPPALPTNPQQNNPTAPFVFSDLLNVFLFRRDLNLGATIKALETKNLIQLLAEPNVLAQNGKEASFLAGGEFPYPVVQGSGATGIPAVTVQFHEFGVRLNFVPLITPRGTIQLKIAPEVSSLDYTNGLTVQGFNIPALSTRRVETEVELGDGQSFAIAGLLDRRVTDTFAKMPLIGDLPVLGKLFQSKNTVRNNTELLVIVTPELVRPMPAGAPPMNLPFPKTFLESSPATALQTPGPDKTGPVPAPPSQKSIPVEKLLKEMAEEKGPDGNGRPGGSRQEGYPMPMPSTTPAQQNSSKK
jgi:pilus assembly protein CpaC